MAGRGDVHCEKPLTLTIGTKAQIIKVLNETKPSFRLGLSNEPTSLRRSERSRHDSRGPYR